MKKDYSQIDTGRVYDAIAEATAETQEPAQAAQEEQEPPKKQYKPRKTYTPEEAAAILSTLKTSGRKGVKLPRINLAFTPQVHDYVSIMSRARGESMTEFVNLVLREHMDKHMDIYRKALEFISSL